MFKLRFIAVLFCICVLFGAVGAFAQTASCTFTYFQLPTNQFVATFTEGINRYGNVVGTGCGTDTPSECLGNRGFIRYPNGSQKLLLAPNSTDTMFSKRNANGVTVGGSRGTGGRRHGIVYYNGTWRTVDYPGAVGTNLTGVNLYSTIIGNWTDSAGRTHSFKLKDGKFTRIDFPGALDTYAQNISDAGVIVGWYEDTSGTVFTNAFVLKNGVYTKTDHPNGTTSFWDINAKGTIVGDQDNRPFILKDGVFWDVVVPGSNGYSLHGINGYGTITGTAYFGLESKGYVANCTFPTL